MFYPISEEIGGGPIRQDVQEAIWREFSTDSAKETHREPSAGSTKS